MSSRRLEILRAIVDEYVATQEPVGSKSIAERHGLGISPATIRNEMAVLEDEGLITHPHTSAGRIPTDRGYRVFVDKLAEVKPLSGAGGFESAASGARLPLRKVARAPARARVLSCTRANGRPCA